MIWPFFYVRKHLSQHHMLSDELDVKGKDFLQDSEIVKEQNTQNGRLSTLQK